MLFYKIITSFILMATLWFVAGCFLQKVLSPWTAGMPNIDANHARFQARPWQRLGKMGCAQSNDKINPQAKEDSIANRQGTGKEANTMLQHLIKEHRKEKVDSVYQINWDDNEALGSGATSTVRIAINKTTQEKYR